MTPDALARLHATAFEQDRPWDPDEFAALLTHPGTLLLGDERAFILGRVIIDEAEVLTLATHPDHRRQGLATTLLARFEQEAAAMGAARAFLEVAEDNVPARALYVGRGYVEAGRRPAYYLRSGSAPVAALVLWCPFR
jgi:[ribosomal protein S18]-alanine N-acetyltransferase